MSHHTIRLNGKAPSVTGEITLNVDELADVTTTTSPTDSQVLQWVEANQQWEYADAPTASVAADQYILIGRGESSAYSGSGASSLGGGATIYFYDTSPTNTIVDATITSSGGWVSSVSLPAGKYAVQAQVNFDFSASGYLVFKANGTDVTSNYATIGATASTYGFGASTVSAVIANSAPTTLSFVVGSSSNVTAVGSQGNTQAEQCSLFIRRVL